MMQTDIPFMPPHLSLREAQQWAVAHDAPLFLVGSADHLVGIVTREQLQEPSAQNGNDNVTSIASTAFTHAHADHPVDVVLDRLNESGGLLPIVSRADIRRVDGIVTPESLLSSRVARRLRRSTGASDSIKAVGTRVH